MKRLAMLLVLAGAALGASWDGTRGTLTVITQAVDLRMVSPSANPFVTFISVSSSSPLVNNVRVTIKYRDESGNLRRATQESDAPTNGTPMTVSFPVQPSQIVDDPYIEARVITTDATSGLRP